MRDSKYCPACGHGDIEPFDAEILVCANCNQLLYKSELVGPVRARVTRVLGIEWPYEDGS